MCECLWIISQIADLLFLHWHVSVIKAENAYQFF